MNELRTHIVSSVCLCVIFLIPLFFDTNPLWLVGVIFLILLMLVRSSSGEISKNSEKLFILLNIFVLIAAVIISLIEESVL